MYRLGKIVGFSLQREVLAWTIVGLSVTAWEVFLPSDEHRKFLKYDQLEVAPVTERLPVTFENVTEKSKTADVPQINVDEFLTKDDKKLFAVFDFYSLRIYFLTYIILLYPACVGMGELLATPWMVVAGVRVLTPKFICRTYMWILVYSYWIWLMDKELLSHRGVPPSLIKAEPWQDDKKEDDLELRENRRRAKGVRPQVARLSPSEVLGVSPYKSRNGSRDILDSVMCDMICVKSDTIIPMIEVSEISGIDEGEDDSAEEENVKINEERQILAKKHSTPPGPARVSDCLLRQLAHLLFKLTKYNYSNVQEDDDRDIISDIDIFRRCCIISPDAALILASPHEAVLQCPRYPTPRYLSDYPKIFGKSPRRNQRTESSFQELNRLLFSHHSVDQNMRNHNLRRPSSTNFNEKVTNNDVES